MEANVNRSMTESKSGAQMRDEVHSLKHALGKLRTDVAELFTHAFGFGRGGVKMARGYGNDAVDNMKHRFEEVRARGGERMRDFETRVSENPLRSAMIAFGVGFFLAKLMHRRDRS